MFKQNTYRFGTVSRILAVLLGLVLVVTITIATTVYYAREATAAPSTYLNFQARLRSSTGSIVPDGNYNIEFKLYDQASGGSTLWTETRTGGNVVRVANGYFSVSLGSVTAFPTNIQWGEEHWITMNIGGTGSPSWDGEMNPRLQLTAVPFAFQAERAGTADVSTATQGVVTNTADPSGINGAMYYSTTTNKFRIFQNGGWGDMGTGDILDGGQDGVVTIGTNDSSPLNLRTNGTNRFTIQADGSIAMNTNALFVNAVNNRVGIGTITPNHKLEVISNSVAVTSDIGAYLGVVVAPISAPVTYTSYAGARGTSFSSSANVNNNFALRGLEGFATYGGSGAAGDVLGGQFSANLTGVGSVNNLWGISVATSNTSSGTATNVRGIQVNNPTNSGGGTITNNHGIHISNQTAGTNNYGLYIQGASTYALWVDAGVSRFDGEVRIGEVDATGTLLVLDTKTDSGDPTGVNGGMYYNSSVGKFRCYEGGSWKDCIGAAGGDILQDGNSFGADMTIGTNDSYGLNLETDGATRMTIGADGNIGIGTANPLAVGPSFSYSGNEQILHINSATDRARLTIQGATSAGIALFNGAGADDERFVALNNENGNTFFRVFDDSGVVARTPLVIQNATGNVGIGTTDPTNLLHVDGDQIVVTRGTSGSVELGATPSNQIGLIFRNTGRADVRRYPDRLSLLTTSGNGIPTTDNGINILNNGNVGIGTISPSVRLDIEGAAGSNAGLRVNAVTGYYGMQYFAENGVNKWHYEAAPTAHGGHFSIVESGVAERLRISPGGAVSLAGHSASWGVAPTTGLRINMGTSSAATWLIGGYSGANFRGGIQLLDNGNAMRLYAGGNYLEFGNNNLTVGGALSVGGNITSSGGGLIINGVTRIHNSGAIVGTTGTFSGNVSVNGTLNLGASGQTFTAIRRTTIAWDPPSTANNNESFHHTTCLPAGSVVIGVVAPGNGPSSGAAHYRWGSDYQGTVRFAPNSTEPCPVLSFVNWSGSSINPASGSWQIWYIAP